MYTCITGTTQVFDTYTCVRIHRTRDTLSTINRACKDDDIEKGSRYSGTLS